MKIAYIAHPIGIKVEENIDLILDIVWKINFEESETVPFVPYLADIMCMSNTNDERDRGIRNDHCLIRKGFIDELRLYGDHISMGMLEELMLALDLGIPVIPMTEETGRELKDYKIK